MPSEEVACVVYGKGLLDVCCNEVIVATAHAGCLRQWCLCFELAQTLDCRDVLFPLLFGQFAPRQTLSSVLSGRGS